MTNRLAKSLLSAVLAFTTIGTTLTPAMNIAVLAANAQDNYGFHFARLTQDAKVGEENMSVVELEKNKYEITFSTKALPNTTPNPPTGSKPSTAYLYSILDRLGFSGS